MTIIKVPIRINSLNVQEHWTKKSKQNKLIKILLKSELNKLKPKPQPPCTITLTRIGPRKLDKDNLIGGMKFITDTVADFLIPNLPPGQADGDMRLKFQYEQRKGLPKEYALEIKFTGYYPDPIAF